MEIGYALDFTSLILSGQVPKQQVESTISPFLKQMIPLATLGAEVGQAPSMTERIKGDSELVSTGWKLQSLSKAADSLLKSASRLEEDMVLEAKYWEDVISIKSKGWSICRLPRERQTLCVRYGFAEGKFSFPSTLSALPALLRLQILCFYSSSSPICPSNITSISTFP